MWGVKEKNYAVHSWHFLSDDRTKASKQPEHKHIAIKRGTLPKYKKISYSRFLIGMSLEQSNAILQQNGLPWYFCSTRRKPKAGGVFRPIFCKSPKRPHRVGVALRPSNHAIPAPAWQYPNPGRFRALFRAFLAVA